MLEALLARSIGVILIRTSIRVLRETGPQFRGGALAE